MKNKFEKLLKINIWISKYLLYSLPVTIGTGIFALNVSGGGENLNGLASTIWNILGWHFMLCFSMLVYFLISLFLWNDFREKILTAVTFSNVRDERESFISGKASRSTFYSTLAMMIILFFLSGLNVHIYKKPKSEAIDGKRGVVTIGYRFEFINSAKKSVEKNEKNIEEILVVDGVPFTQESLILFLIIYHTFSYHFFSRKKLV